MINNGSQGKFKGEAALFHRQALERCGRNREDDKRRVLHALIVGTACGPKRTSTGLSSPAAVISPEYAGSARRAAQTR